MTSGGGSSLGLRPEANVKGLTWRTDSATPTLCSLQALRELGEALLLGREEGKASFFTSHWFEHKPI